MTRIIAIGLTLLTGFSGLVYEVTWQKYLATLLGSQSEATAAVLGLFLGGLSIGYAGFGRISRALTGGARSAAEVAARARDGLALYGAVEAAIGLYALAFPHLFRLAQALSLAAPVDPAQLSFGFDVALAGLLIGPPSVLMGATIPILTQVLPARVSDATRVHALVYGCNTVGAFCGALAAGFWLLPAYGLVGTLDLMCALNVTAGAAYLALSRSVGRSEPARAVPSARNAGADASMSNPATEDAPGSAAAGGAFAGAALLAGFAAMTIQTVLIRVGGLAFGASQFTFSTVVAVFVLCIAIGSLAVSTARRLSHWLLVANLWALTALLAALSLWMDDAGYWVLVLRGAFSSEISDFIPFHLAAFGGILVAIALPVALSGASLPLIFDHLRREWGELGTAAGSLYSWNTLGSLLGALVGGYGLLFWLDLHEVYQLALVAFACAAYLVSVRVLGPSRRLASALGLGGCVAAIALLPGWDPQRMGAGLFRNTGNIETRGGPDEFFAHLAPRRGDLRFYSDDPITTIAVYAHGSRPDLSLFTSGKSDGALYGDYVTTGLVALVPALVAERAESAFVIGYGTGATAGELAALDSIRKVVISEISPGVMQAAPLFDHGNLGVRTSPKVQIARGDAYRTLLRTQERFDVIVSEPSNPWVTGIEMLYSREFLEAARDKLAPGGVYSQWIHLYETDNATVELVLRTYASVFDHVAVWFTKQFDIMLLGFDDADNALDVERIVRRMGRPDFAAGLARCSVPGPAALFAHEVIPLGVLHETALPGPLQTLLHPRLNYLAARAFFTGGQGRLPRAVSLPARQTGERNALLRRYARARGGLSDEDRQQIADTSCGYKRPECVPALAEWAAVAPQSPLRAEAMASVVAARIFGGDVSIERVDEVSALYGAAWEDDAGPVARARRLSDHFVSYYHYGLPFSAALLAGEWERCSEETRGSPACPIGQRTVETILGPLDTEARPRRRGRQRSRPSRATSTLDPAATADPRRGPPNLPGHAAQKPLRDLTRR